jgi:hypothetical protein
MKKEESIYWHGLFLWVFGPRGRYGNYLKKVIDSDSLSLITLGLGSVFAYYKTYMLSFSSKKEQYSRIFFNGYLSNNR